MNRLLSFLIAVLCLAAVSPSKLYADEEFNMPKKDGTQGDKIVDGALSFYDMGGPSGATVSYYAGYTRFVPATEGNQIRITFDMLDLNSSNDAVGIYIYDGDCGFSSYSAPIPEGYLAKISGTEAGQTFESSTGSLSILYYGKGSASGDGWKASVEEVSSIPMQWREASALTPEGSAYRGQHNAPIVCANLLTEGGGDPFYCSELKFNLAGTTNLSSLKNIKVMYSKGQNTPGGEQFGEAVVAADGTLTFSGSQKLRGGNNYFWLVADLTPDAAGSLDGSLVSATVAGTERVAAPIAPQGNVNIENSARLSITPAIYNVGEGILTFYDDGGPENPISLNFDGYATFRPNTEGKVVKVTFTSLDLFNTSTINKNDILNIYNGSEVNADNLVATLLNDATPVAITSQAEDGSLTISLKSLTGTNPKAGFVAAIEEVIPSNMTIDAVEVTHPTTDPASAGDTKADVLLIRVNTSGTLTPYSVSSMKFANSSTAAVEKASLYWLGSDKTANGSLVGETANPGETFTITLSEPQVLAERNNYFMLAYTPAEKALSGQNIDAALTLINSDYNVEAGAPEGNRSIDNIVYSDDTTQSRTIYGSWKFQHKKSGYSSYSYEKTNGDQVTTFLPGTEGKIVELEFSEFKLRTSSYQAAPSFKIFDGKNTSAPVLWEATSSADFEKGPQRIIRPTNADGALTVLFNSQLDATSGYGFKANVSEYQSVPMTFVSAKGTQVNNGGNVRPGAEDVIILCIEAVTQGDKNPLDLNSVSVDLKDGYEAVSKVKLYSTGVSDVFASPLKIAEVEAQGKNVTLTPSSGFNMPEKTSYLWVAYDMKDPLTSDIKVDAAITELKIGGQAVEISDADPEGEASTKNIVYFDGSGRRVIVDGSMLFYDDGGPDEKYSKETSGTMIFVPAHEGEVIRFTIQEFYTRYNDYFYVYEGIGTDEANLVKTLSSSVNAETAAPIISRSADGALTVKFEPQYNYNDGWAILVESFVPQPMAVKSIEVTPVNDTKMLRGSADNKLLKLAVRVAGEKGAATINKFDFSALESDDAAITAAKVYYTGTVDNFDRSNLFGSATETPFSIDGSMSIAEAGTYYFWLTYDIATDAATDSKVQAQFISLTSNGETIAAPDEKKVLITVQDGMHGTYSVGTSGDHDFLTIREAVDALTDGIDGPVVFELENGNYNELVSVPEVIGSSEINTVTFRSKSGNREDVVISYNRYTDPGSSNYDKRYGVFTFDGIDYCTLEGVTVTTTDSNFPGLVFLRNKCEHITLDNCVFRMPSSAEYSTGSSYLVYMYVKSDDINANHNYSTVQNCLFDGGYVGMGLTGTSTVANPKQKGGRILNNVFRNQGSKAIYLANEEDAVIAGNDILIEGTTASSPYGMDLSEFGGSLDVYGNVIRIKTCTGRYTPNPMGIYLRVYNLNNVKAGQARIYNNEINITDTPGNSACGIRFNTNLTNLDLAGNTIRIAAANPEGERVEGIYVGGDIKGCRVMNNIIRLDTPGSVIYAANQSYLNGAAFSHNVIYTPGENICYIGDNKANVETPEGFTGGYMSFEDFCTWAPMSDSYFEQTEFLSDEILEPANAGNLLNGEKIDYLTTDLYGATRAEIPTIGAYEYAESSVAPAMTDGYPVVKNVTHDSAEFVVKSALTGKISYCVYNSEHTVPTAEEVMNEDLTLELRKGVEASVILNGLQPNASYKVYAVLTSLRGLNSEVIASDVFTTSYEPTRTATFEEASEEDMRLIDGTMSFTGFSVEEIADGVAPLPNTKAAVMDDEYAVIQLTNAVNLGLEGMFMRNSEVVTLTAMDDELTELKTVDVEASQSWRYVDLRDMGKFTYLTLESEGDVYIDNVGALPLQMLLCIDRDEDLAIPAGEEYSLTVDIDGGVAPYSYEWMDAAHNVKATTEVYTYTPTVSNTYSVVITDARGATASAKTQVRVISDMAVATFDDLYLPEDSHWCGDADDEDYMQGSFFSGSFEFNNLYMADWDSWAFFGYSNHTATSFSSYITDQWNSAVGHGADDSANYGIVFVSPYMGRTTTTLSNTEEGQVIPGMYITNSAWVVDAILNGDGMSEGNFGEGDNLMLKLTGTAADGSTTELEIPLADYRDANDKDRWYLDTWQWVDLSALGKVVSVNWDMTSTKSNFAGMTTPAYVCIDNLGAGRPVNDGETVILAVNDEESPVDSFDLAPYFSFDAEEGTVKYEIETDDDRLSLEGNTVSCSAKAGEQLNLIAHATQRGRHEWINIPVSMIDKPLGIAKVELEGVVMYPNPADSYVKVNAKADEYNVAVYSTDGRAMMKIETLSGASTVNTSALPSGTYIVKISDNQGHTAVRKLIVKH